MQTLYRGLIPQQDQKGLQDGSKLIIEDIIRNA